MSRKRRKYGESSRKGNSDETDSDWTKPLKRVVRGNESCILHKPDLPYSDFTLLSSVDDETKAKLVTIKAQRLQEPIDSPYRLQSICDQIPSDLSNCDIHSGYHRNCHQNVIGNVDRLKCNKPGPSSELPRRSPRKRKSTEVGNILFEKECIFCRGKKSLQKFPSFVGREASWKQIEPHALELGEVRLYRLVQGEDLHSKVAQYHQKCLNSFKLRYSNYKRKKEAENCEEKTMKKCREVQPMRRH